MSHKATNWAISQRGISPAAKVILWHLCDRHHSDNGCFPSQETLAADCEVSRATLNRHLDQLEEFGLIRRIKRTDKERRRQLSTLYLFSFNFEDPFGFDPGADGGGNEPENGGQEGQKPCLKLRHGAVSQKQQKPCLKNAKSRVSNRDTNPVREPLKNQAALPDNPDLSDAAAFWASKISEGRFVPESALTEAMKAEIASSGLLTDEQLIASGVLPANRAS